MTTPIELADFDSLRRFAVRTRRTQVALALAAVAAIAFAAALVPRHARAPGAVVPPGSSAIVVLDLSASISSDTFARIAATLDELRREGGRAGLVVFSDTAYQTLPPGTPVRELASFQRFFAVPAQSQAGAAAAPPTSPWTDSFSGGTRISTGLQLALDVIRGQSLRRPLVVLVSDLNDDTADLESLTSVALAYRSLHIPIKVVGLNPASGDTRLIQRLLPPGGTIVGAKLPGQHGGAAVGRIPRGTLVFVGLLAVLLAAFLAFTERLRWVEV